MREDVKGHWEISKSNRRRPLVAWRAMENLLKDGEATGEVFKIIEALKGNAFTRATDRLRASDEGDLRLAVKPDILEMLEDRETLRKLPEDSLGHTYLRFVETENLSADGLMDASMEAPLQRARDEDEIWFGERLRDTHDLFHVVTGYGRDGLGEIALLEFSCTQTKNLGIRFVVYMSNRQSKKDGNWEAIKPVMEEAHALAQNTKWFAEQDWERLLKMPLTEVREELGVTRPRVYKEVQAANPDPEHPPTEYELAA